MTRANASGATVLDASFKAFVGHPAASHGSGGTNAVTVAFFGLFAFLCLHVDFLPIRLESLMVSLLASLCLMFPLPSNGMSGFAGLLETDDVTDGFGRLHSTQVQFVLPRSSS